MSTKSPIYFASLNSSCGFQNYFSSIFDPTKLKQIFILKGGPGVGKSSIMKNIALYSDEIGEPYEKFLCSSDPTSLDGILLTRKNVAILDGTSPHNADPIFPGVVENIVNLGSFWDVKKLLPHKELIFDLIKRKKQFYQSAYQFVSAYGKISDDVLSYLSKNLMLDKMKKNIQTQTEYFFKKAKKSQKSIRNIATISKDGIINLRTFEELSERIWIIDDFCQSGHLYLEELEKIASTEMQTCTISCSPIFPDKPNAIYFPEYKVAFILGKRDYEAELPEKEYHYINMKRFLAMGEISQGKQKIKFALKCNQEVLDMAIDSLQKAAATHSELEKYYISAMNFEKVNQIQKEILDNIFSS